MRRDGEQREGSEHILALNKNGVSFLDLITHETLLHYPFTEVCLFTIISKSAVCLQFFHIV